MLTDIQMVTSIIWMSTAIRESQPEEPRHEEIEGGGGADPQADRRGGLVRVPQERDRRDWAQRPDEGCRPNARRLLQALRLEGPARRGGHHRGSRRSARRDG